VAVFEPSSGRWVVDRTGVYFGNGSAKVARKTGRTSARSWLRAVRLAHASDKTFDLWALGSRYRLRG
jgi:hypothetical protein